MSVLHTLALAVAACIEGVSGLLNPAFTVAFSKDYYTPSLTVPVLFDTINTNVGSMYNATTGTAFIPMDGIYWVTIYLQPSAYFKQNELVLTVNEAPTKLRTWVDGFRMSRSAGCRLKKGDKLTVMAKVVAALRLYTFWSVAYIGDTSQVFSAWVSSNSPPRVPLAGNDNLGEGHVQLPKARFAAASQERARENPVFFQDIITYDRFGITQNRFGLFTILVRGLYLVHLSAAGDRDLVLVLQKQVSLDSEWTDVLFAGAVESGRPSSVDAVLGFTRGTRLRVFRRGTALPGSMTLFSIVNGIGGVNYQNTSAFTGETQKKGEVSYLYKRGNPVKFDKVLVNTMHDYDTVTYTYTVPFDSVYIVSLRPYTKPTKVIDNGRLITWPCCYNLCFELENATHVLMSALADTYTPLGFSAAIYLSAGDKLKVFPYVPSVPPAPTVVDSSVWYGSLFSIANLSR